MQGPQWPTAEEAATGAYDATTVHDTIFEELRSSSDVALEVQLVWKAFMGAAENRKAAGETIYQALYGIRSGLDVRFMHHQPIRFMDGLSLIIDSLSDPKGLKDVVEEFAYSHVDLACGRLEVIKLRDDMVGLLVAKMGPRLSQKARVGFATMLNYVGGSCIFIHREFELRRELKRVLWRIATSDMTDVKLDGDFELD